MTTEFIDASTTLSHAIVSEAQEFVDRALESAA